VPNFIPIRSEVLILWGVEIWPSHRNEVSPLTQGLNYRSACDAVYDRCITYSDVGSRKHRDEEDTVYFFEMYLQECEGKHRKQLSLWQAVIA